MNEVLIHATIYTDIQFCMVPYASIDHLISTFSLYPMLPLIIWFQHFVCCVITVDHFNIPVIASLPHFLYADPKYLAQVEGLHPNEKEHRTDVCIEPVS